jgi:hypothetical protein
VISLPFPKADMQLAALNVADSQNLIRVHGARVNS